MEDSGGGDAIQMVQRQQRYRSMDTVAEEMQNRQQKRCGTTDIAVLGAINHNRFIRIAMHTPDQEDEWMHRIGYWRFWRRWREGGGGKYGNE